MLPLDLPSYKYESTENIQESLTNFLLEYIDYLQAFNDQLDAQYDESVYENFEKKFIGIKIAYNGMISDHSHPYYRFFYSSQHRRNIVIKIIRSLA